MLKKLATWSIRARNGTEALCFGWVPERIRCRHTTVGAQIRKKPTVELRDAVSKLMRDVVRRAQMTCLRGQQSENGIRKTLYLCTTRRTFGWIEATNHVEKTLATWSIRARNGTEALFRLGAGENSLLTNHRRRSHPKENTGNLRAYRVKVNAETSCAGRK